MKKTAFISDLLFTFFTVFLFTLCLFRYWKTSLWLAALLAIACGMLAACAVGAFLQSKRKHFLLKKSDEAQKQKLLFHLTLLPDDKKNEFFRKLFSTEEYDAARCGKSRISTPNEFYFLHFHFAPVCADDILPAARIKTKKQKILLCIRIEEEALALCQRFDIDVKTGDEVYLLIKKADALPEKFLGDELAAQKKKRRTRLWFAKSNCRRFLTGGALILLTSLLTPFSYYYLIFGTVLLIAAAFVRIFGYE